MKNVAAYNLFVPALLFVGFFVVQVLVTPGEDALTVLIISATVLVFVMHRYRGEFLLWSLGLIAGLFVEVVLGLVARQQYWEGASLFGVPFWLPFVWALGVVAITRAGIAIRKWSGDTELT